MTNNKLSHKIRPVYLTDMRSLGGGETSLLNLLTVLCDAGIRSVLLCPKGDLFREASSLDIDLYEIEYPDVHLKAGFMPTFSVSCVVEIARILQKHSVSVIHVESLLALYYGGITSFLTGTPLVATYHGYWPLHSRITKFALRLLCKRIYPVSKSMESELRSLGAIPTRGRTIPLGVNPAYLEPLPSREEARRQLGLSLERFIVLQVARFEEIKGHHNLLDALVLLANETGKSMPLVLFVGGVLDPPSQEVLIYKERIEERASRPDLLPHVLFLGHRQDVPLIMRAADIVVIPSVFESFGMAVIEAMTIGTPVVATNAGGPREIIKHGKTGLLVPPEDPVALASGIRQLLEHPDESAHIAAAAQLAALELYGPLSRCETLVAEYRQLMKI
jgi:glycosyltransferase involved in cell wall biosynthesis